MRSIHEMIEQFVFYSFSLLILCAGLAVASFKDPIYNVLSLVVAFIGAAGLYLLLNAQFLSMVLITVYVGAVAVFFMFVVMTLEGVWHQNTKKISPRKKVFAIILGVIFSIEIIFILVRSFKFSIIKKHHELTLKDLSISIFQDNYHLLIITGVILLIAMVGAILITKNTFTFHEKMKKQNVSDQNEKNRSDCVKLVKVEFGKGLK